MTEEIIAVIICEKFGWTYQQYLDQPDWFIQAILIKGEIDSDHAARETRKLKRTR